MEGVMKSKHLSVLPILFFVLPVFCSINLFAQEDFSDFGIVLNPFFRLGRGSTLEFQFFLNPNSAWVLEAGADFTDYNEALLLSAMFYGGYCHYFSRQKGFFIQADIGLGYVIAGDATGFIGALVFFTGYRFLWNKIIIEPKINIGLAYADSLFGWKYGWSLSLGILF